MQKKNKAKICYFFIHECYLSRFKYIINRYKYINNFAKIFKKKINSINSHLVLIYIIILIVLRNIILI